jgi:hypothetical protein
MIIRATTGERFLCKTEANLQEAVIKSTPVKVTEIYSVVTVSMMGQMGPSRMTALEYPDLQDEKPLESMMILPAAWYKFPDERAEAEIKELTDSMAKAKEYRDQMEEAARASESGLVQARLGLQGQGMPGGMPSMFGGLTKPPGVR